MNRRQLLKRTFAALAAFALTKFVSVNAIDVAPPQQGQGPRQLAVITAVRDLLLRLNVIRGFEYWTPHFANDGEIMLENGQLVFLPDPKVSDDMLALAEKVKGLL